MAGSFLAAIPTLLIYILLRRYVMRELLAGSLEGDRTHARSAIG